jgi:very-short-patch-repair endonuclease
MIPGSHKDVRILRNLFGSRAGGEPGPRRRAGHPPCGAQHRRSQANRCLWSLLGSRKLRAWQFRRQHTLGPYVVDFVCLKEALVIEVGEGPGAEAQQIRRHFLEKLGYRVLRFEPGQILRESASVRRIITERLEK